jgi:Bacterial regulatory proteins, tetR family
MRHTRNTDRLLISRTIYRISPTVNPLSIANFADAAADPRKQRTRAALSAAMLSLLQERAFEEVTIRAVTKRARISYPTFFSHYEVFEEFCSI